MAVPKKVLVVDDEPNFLKLLSTRLRVKGYQVITAPDGEAALEKIRKDKPDAVLLDILMPKLDGLKTLREIRKTHKQLPVYVLTAFSNERRFGAAKRLGASGFIVKNDDLGQAIRNITSSLSLASKYRPVR